MQYRNDDEIKAVGLESKKFHIASIKFNTLSMQPFMVKTRTPPIEFKNPYQALYYHIKSGTKEFQELKEAGEFTSDNDVYLTVNAFNNEPGNQVYLHQDDDSDQESERSKGANNYNKVKLMNYYNLEYARAHTLTNLEKSEVTNRRKSLKRESLQTGLNGKGSYYFKFCF